MADNSTIWHCNGDIDHDKFSKSITGLLWRVDALLLVNAILAGAIVGIGAYGHRYRHHGFTRHLFLGASALFLPIISHVLSASGSTKRAFTFDVPLIILNNPPYHSRDDVDILIAECQTNGLHPYLVIVSTCLVLISAINTSPVVATDDREDRSIGPPFELLLQGIWTACLIVDTDFVPLTVAPEYLRYTPFALIYAKMALKYYAFLKARRSFALGRNPRLIVGYMQQLPEGSQHEDVPPPLVVMGEDQLQVEEQPHGYVFSKNLEATEEALVTIDRVQLRKSSLAIRRHASDANATIKRNMLVICIVQVATVSICKVQAHWFYLHGDPQIFQKRVAKAW